MRLDARLLDLAGLLAIIAASAFVYALYGTGALIVTEVLAAGLYRLWQGQPAAGGRRYGVPMAATLLPRENVRFLLGPTPLLLMAEAPIHRDLPVLHAPGGAMSTCAGWQLMARMTVCVVDGPDTGCLIPAIGTSGDPGDLEGVAAWCSAVGGAGGAVVVSLPAIPVEIDWDEVFTGGVARGGFVRSADAAPEG